MDDVQPPQVEYKLTDEDWETLHKWRHFKPHGDQSRRYIRINQETKGLAKIVMYNCPPSRERVIALNKLEEVRLWANQAIMKNEKAADDNV
jgi:hypothetical protein